LARSFPKHLCGTLSRFFLLSRKTCRGVVSPCELAQFGLRNSKFCGTKIQTDYNLGKYPHDGLVNFFGFRKMNAHLRAELFLVCGLARLAGHTVSIALRRITLVVIF